MTTLTTIKINIKEPNKVFNKNIFEIINDYSHFTEVHYGGGSSGKSHGVVQKVVLKALKNGNILGKYYGLEKYKQLLLIAYLKM